MLFTISILKAQQEPMTSQYMLNIQSINPAYAGTWRSLGFTALSRFQWVGIEGAPKTQMLTIQGNVLNEKLGLGLSLISDKIGFEDRFSVYTDFSYRVQLNSRKLFLRLGLKLGFDNYKNDLSSYTLINPADPSYSRVINEKFVFNSGVGAFLYSPKFYVGLSIPHLLNHKVKLSDDKTSYSTSYKHMYLMGAYVFSLSDYIDFKPSVMTKMVLGAPLQSELNAALLFDKTVWFNLLYRTDNTVGCGIQYILKNNIRLGYAVDYSTQGLLRTKGFSHEVVLSFELGSRFKSPRYF